MQLENDICLIEIIVDDTYTVDSADNKPYDIILNPCGYQRGDLSKTFSITVDLYDKTFTIALIGGYYSYEMDCAILEQSILTILQDNVIVRLNVLEGRILLHKKLHCFGCNYGIYKVDVGYIVFGEMEILMLDKDLYKKWSFSARDIFVKFTLCADFIELYDWENNFYKIDFDGKMISEIYIS